MFSGAYPPTIIILSGYGLTTKHSLLPQDIDPIFTHCPLNSWWMVLTRDVTGDKLQLQQLVWCELTTSFVPGVWHHHQWARHRRGVWLPFPVPQSAELLGYDTSEGRSKLCLCHHILQQPSDPQINNLNIIIHIQQLLPHLHNTPSGYHGDDIVHTHKFALLVSANGSSVCSSAWQQLQRAQSESRLNCGVKYENWWSLVADPLHISRGAVFLWWHCTVSWGEITWREKLQDWYCLQYITTLSDKVA